MELKKLLILLSQIQNYIARKLKKLFNVKLWIFPKHNHSKLPIFGSDYFPSRSFPKHNNWKSRPITPFLFDVTWTTKLLPIMLASYEDSLKMLQVSWIRVLIEVFFSERCQTTNNGNLMMIANQTILHKEKDLVEN